MIASARLSALSDFSSTGAAPPQQLRARRSQPSAPAASWNMYAYVRNNPLRFVDPDGRKCKDGTDENGNACLVATAHASWLGKALSKIGLS